MKQKILTLAEIKARMPAPAAEIVMPKQPTYQELEAKALAASKAHLATSDQDYSRLRRSAGFID